MGWFLKRISLYPAGQRLLRFVIVFALLFIGQTPFAHAANTIAGIISLPDAEVAPAGGISLRVSAGNRADRASEELFIPAGEASVAYSLTLPVSSESAWIVSYSYSGSLPYLPRGYYSTLSTTTGTTWIRGATWILLDGDSSHTGIDMMLLPGNRIRGVVSLPAGQFAPVGGIAVDVVVSNDYPASFYSPYSERYSVLIPEGETSAPYVLSMMPWERQRKYVYYEYSGSLGYLHWGLYSPSGTTLDGARLLSSDVPHSGIDLTLLTGRKISGSISLPSGNVAPAGGMWIDIMAEEANFSYEANTRAFVAEGQSSAPYSLVLPPVHSWTYWVSYSYSGLGAYLSRGHYHPSGTLSKRGALLAGGTDHPGIDLTLLPGNLVSGILRLPPGRVAPAGGLQGDLTAHDAGLGDYGRSFSIPEGAASVTYSTVVAIDSLAEWRIQYNFRRHYFSGLPFPQDGYYTPSGTTWDEDAAILLPGGQDHSSIDLLLPAPNQIRGSLSLPPGDVAPAGGVEFEIHSHSSASNSPASTQVIIPEGASSATYSLAVPSDGSDQIKLSYAYAGDASYLPQAYYSNSGSVESREQATALAGGRDHDSIDFAVVEGIRFSGRVNLPSGEVASSGGIFVTVSVYDRNNYQHFPQTGVYIKTGATSAPYSLVLPSRPNAALALSYEYDRRWGELKYLRKGHYATTGTTWDAAAATLLDAHGSREDLNLTLLVGSRISGNLSLPAGQVAPSGGLIVKVTASGQPDYALVEQSFFIDQGVSSIPYSLAVKPLALQRWKVYYKYRGREAFDSFGYHAATGTTWERDQATPLIGSSDFTGIDLDLIALPQVSGAISLPPGEVAPAGGLEIYVRAISQNQNQNHGEDSKRVFMAEGQISAAYTINTHPHADTAWVIAYDFYGNAPYLSEGYYAASGTQPNVAQATLLAGGRSFSGIGLSLLAGQRISGSVALPQGEVAPPGRAVRRYSRYKPGRPRSGDALHPNPRGSFFHSLRLAG